MEKSQMIFKKLNILLSFQRCTWNKDQQQNWQNVFQQFAGVLTQSYRISGQDTYSEKNIIEDHCCFQLRFNPDIKKNMRFWVNNQVLYIEEVININHENRFMHIICSSRWNQAANTAHDQLQLQTYEKKYDDD